MARQLESYHKDFLTMTQEERMEVVRRVRYNKYEARPAAVSHRTRAKKKTERKSSKKIEALLSQLTPEQLAELKKQHGVD